ncbi:hypothetical protein GW920_00095 [Candidatus Falkowbacteria bacterium]|uniref:Deoxynucleoside kinase domain-containing protein n=1 Tax=Candidatus Falkowbacteria bacterium CG10_big_fil_rev_8_21_14_0_10_37_18 TaxID=1974562 RepID=A0A2H0V833_9BACT|nr:hypothetical protein [Candidatus Falkowbacteria bacterium]NCQ13105.1 hypothetical protein [Candidatus Falkowbacteria bacterium]OIO06164.1 MAG: hypothetical protein AUJ26_01315 [Candidatus Falkowbacteria bacterium CG1_02_37_21]PIR95228.1 MAG: hypothetical protein COT93_03490 [Candidatus Falkowbacteria bacterium CG10_big_fil_rev_8_21_14_0_10_37_18]
MDHHLIFEGAELSGKSWVMSQIYKYLEPVGATSDKVLNGCYWFNCDLGFFGTELAPKIIPDYLHTFQTLKDKNILVEKFHLSELIYDELYNAESFRNFSAADFQVIDQKLKKLNFKIILLTFPEDKALLAKRLQDRLNLYPHYGRIAKTPEFYLQQQALYKERIKNSSLDYLILEVSKFPDEELLAKIRAWIQG